MDRESSIHRDPTTHFLSSLVQQVSMPEREYGPVSESPAKASSVSKWVMLIKEGFF